MFYPLFLPPGRAIFGKSPEFSMIHIRTSSPISADEVGGSPARGTRPETEPHGEGRA